MTVHSPFLMVFSDRHCKITHHTLKIHSFVCQTQSYFFYTYPIPTRRRHGWPLWRWVQRVHRRMRRTRPRGQCPGPSSLSKGITLQVHLVLALGHYEVLKIPNLKVQKVNVCIIPTGAISINKLWANNKFFQSSICNISVKLNVNNVHWFTNEWTDMYSNEVQGACEMRNRRGGQYPRILLGHISLRYVC